MTNEPKYKLLMMDKKVLDLFEKIDFSIDKNNNLVISFNLTKELIKNIKENSLVKMEFLLSKEFYLSILEDFK